MQNLLQCGPRCDFCQGNPFVLLQDGMEAFRLLFSLQMFRGFLARSNDFVGCRIGLPPDNLLGGGFKVERSNKFGGLMEEKVNNMNIQHDRRKVMDF